MNVRRFECGYCCGHLSKATKENWRYADKFDPVTKITTSSKCKILITDYDNLNTEITLNRFSEARLLFYSFEFVIKDIDKYAFSVRTRNSKLDRLRT